MLSVAILDDNTRLLEEYNHMIPAWFIKNNIKGKIVVATSEYREFIREVRNQTVNVCIIDINLRSEVNGLYIAKCLRRENMKTEIIFCTGMLEYMQQAFDVNAYHFITKPVGANLEKCLIKLDKEMEARDKNNCIMEIKSGSRIYYVPFESISHIRREGSKTLIHAANRVIEVYESLELLSSRLDNKFFRCHRAVIINRNYIEYIDKKARRIMLTNGFCSKIGVQFNNMLNNSERGST